MDHVTKHLQRWMRSEFKWGELDCTLAIADYVRDVTGKDPAEPFRGRYSTRAEAVALSGLDNGLNTVFAGGAERLGLTPTDNPKRGDVAALKQGGIEFGGLYLGSRWAVFSLDGLLLLDNPTVLAAWSVRG
ncbi:hypothetical protein [Devosia sp. MC1541]|uniref:DUF6950 family protein n=1 Tax=Devosia sp. MC1541 TaxID=2725264 RepID=UPI00145ED0DD|nr:hypothetical protein [Devosia sp. MC1541]